jgi:Ca-activated chloride channel family protein
MVRPLLFCLRLLPLLFCLSCSQVSGNLLLMRGNFLNSQGLYNEAIVSYMDALAYRDAAPYAEYGLGSVYLSLDERNAALEHFAAAEEQLKTFRREDHRELIYRIHYNSGVVRFYEGEYENAAEQFRVALETDGSRIEAKRNLELSLLSLSRQSGSAASSLSVNPDREGKGPQVLFDYIRQKEEDQWKSREWIEDGPSFGPDY